MYHLLYLKISMDNFYQLMLQSIYFKLSVNELQFKSMNKHSNCEFILKILDIMEQFNEQVKWSFTGKQLVFVNLSVLEQQILPIYFRHKNLQSFIRQLNIYGFQKKQITKHGTKFSHKIFWKGNENNFYKIQRKSKKKIKKLKQLKFYSQNKQIIEEIRQFFGIPENTYQLLFQLLQEKDSLWQCMKKIKIGLDYLFQESKDIRSEKVRKNLTEISTQFYPALQKCLTEPVQINQFITSTIMREKQAHISEIVKSEQQMFESSGNEECSMENYLAENAPINTFLMQKNINRNISFLEASQD